MLWGSTWGGLWSTTDVPYGGSPLTPEDRWVR